jgi:hypothetical protein
MSTYRDQDREQGKGFLALSRGIEPSAVRLHDMQALCGGGGEEEEERNVFMWTDSAFFFETDQAEWSFSW